MNLLLDILFDQRGGTLSMTRKTANTLITASGMNVNMDEIEAVVNGGIDADNIKDDAVSAAKLNSDVVRADYGLLQHTTGALQVDVSDTNPCLEVTDGGVRAKTDETTIERASGGLQLKDGGIAAAKIASDAVTTAKIVDANVTTAKIADANVTAAKLSTDAKDHGGLGGLTDNDHTQYVRGQSTGYKIDSGVNASVGAVSFNFTFASPPVVVLGLSSQPTGDHYQFYVTNVTTTGFTINGYSGITATNNWIAIGTAA